MPLKPPCPGMLHGPSRRTLAKNGSNMTRTFLPGILAMAAIVVASNILVQFLFGQWLTWGAFTYPLAFLVTDIMNRVYGASAARRVVMVGFVVGLVCSLIGTQIMGEFGPLVTLRIAAGSGVAFLVAQLIDVSVFAALRGGNGGARRWSARWSAAASTPRCSFPSPSRAASALSTRPPMSPGRRKRCRFLALAPWPRSGFRSPSRIGR